MDDDAAGDGVDRISALPDDLLHVILGFLPDATAASRTAVLSRRWRRVWIHALGLSFLETEVTCGSVQTWRYESYDAPVRPFSEERDLSAPCRFASFVAWVLARRGDAELRSLKIDMKRRHCASPERANEWIRYAMQHVAESFCLAIPCIWIPYRTHRPAIQLPSRGGAASIRMSLSGYKLQFPVAGAAARYEALTELRLSNASFGEESEEDEEGEAAPGSSLTRTTLGDFVSSCCPGLRKLEIVSPRGLPQLVLRAEALEELLLLTSAEGVRTLDVTAPKLRVLRVQFYARNNANSRYANYYDDSDDDVSKVARVKAPSLQEVAVYTSPHYRRPVLDIHDLAGVRRLVDLHLNIHGQYCRDTDAGLWLLESCPRVEHVSVSLEHCDAGIVTASELVDLGSDGAAPFAMLTSIDMEACIFPRRHLVTSISSLLLRCPRLRLLCIHLIDTDPVRWREKCICDDLDTGRGQNKSLEYLEEVKISGFTGAHEEIDLVRFLFESSKPIKSVTLSVPSEMPCAVSLLKLMGEEDGIDTTDQELLKIPFTDRGCWKLEENVYTWTRYETVSTSM